MDTDSFVINIFTEDFFEDINNDIERWFDTSNYDKNDKRPLQIGTNKKVIGMFKDELGGNIMKKFCAPRGKTMMITNIKKAKGTRKCIIKQKIRFKNYTDSLFENETILRSKLRFKSDLHIVYTEKVNKIAISSNDDKRLQTYDKITTYPYGTTAFKVCESETMIVKNKHK